MKIGIYFCNCGTNIAEKVDPEKVRLALGLGPDFFFKTFGFICSEDGLQWLIQDLGEEKPDRVIFTACSPREHEPTFMKAMENAGINPYMMQMVNLREHNAWVTENPDKAVEKAVRAIHGAINRVQLHDPLVKSELDASSEVLIIGAGPAGLKAALALAEAGRKVIIVEKSPFIGGMPVQFEELFPNMECGPCMLEPVMADVLHGPYHENIELCTLSEVAEVKGFFGNFQVKIRKSPRFVDEHTCIGCGECFEPCPATGKNQYNCSMEEKKAISSPFAGALPNAPYIDTTLCTRFTEGSDCDLCSAACPMGEGVVNFADSEETIERNVGAVVIAVGSSLFDCSKIPNLGYGELPHVYTAFEFERVLASNGPTSGEIVTRTGETPKSFAIMHCVGSLEPDYCSYCSGICCQYAFKLSHIISKKLPDAKVTHFYKQIVAPGKEESAIYDHVRHSAEFIRYNYINELMVNKNGTIVINDSWDMNADIVILCPAVIPGENHELLSKLFEVSLDSKGFFKELHGRIDASQSPVKGVYLAGSCQSPMDIQKAVSQGMASVGYILSQLVEGRKIEVDPITAEVDEQRCAGCKICINNCPYKAISFDEEKKASSVNAVLCHGCGTCVAACPASAIKGNHFTSEQILSEIKGVLQ